MMEAQFETILHQTLGKDDIPSYLHLTIWQMAQSNDFNLLWKAEKSLKFS